MPAELQHDDPEEWFENALFDTPTCKFWQWESERKEQDGSSRARYKFDLRNTPVFLRARGIVRRVMQAGDDSFSRFFMMGNDHTYTELFAGQKGNNKLLPQIRDIMAEWLRAHKDFNDEKGQLSRAIYSAKLEQGIMESIETVDFDEKSFGEDFDHFFFKNTAVKVTRDKLEAVPYANMRQWTNSEAILDGDFRILPRLWHVEEAPFYQAELDRHNEILRGAKVDDEIKQENMRWDQWQSLWRYRLVMDRPLAEMPLHFRFLYNTCRIFWEKEQTQELTKTERQVQDMYFIAMLHAIGSALVRHRSANRQQFIHITDNGTRREDLASGGTGKTAILELFALVRRVLGIDGKALEGSNIILEQELGKVIPGLHNVVCLDELPQGFSPKKMYNLPLSITSRGMYRASVKLTGDDLPKIVIASNEQIDLSSDSTSRRAYQILVGDWYHPRSMDGARQAHTPADDFREEGVKEIAHNLPPQILNEARNLLLQCTQLFLQLPDVTFTPPRDSRAMLRQALAAARQQGHAASGPCGVEGRAVHALDIRLPRRQAAYRHTHRRARADHIAARLLRHRRRREDAALRQEPHQDQPRRLPEDEHLRLQPEHRDALQHRPPAGLPAVRNLAVSDEPGQDHQDRQGRQPPASRAGEEGTVSEVVLFLPQGEHTVP